MMALFGGSSGAVPPFDLIKLSTMGSLFITRPSMKDYIATRADLEHIIRAAGMIVNDDDLIVIGSQSVLGEFPDAPGGPDVPREAWPVLVNPN